MKPFCKITFVACILQCLLCFNAYAAGTIYDWTGSIDNNWTTPGNWKVGTVVQTINYPGLSSSSDIAQIGVSNTFTNQPTIPTAVTIATLTIGTKTSTVTLTINAALVVNGDFTQSNDGSGNGVTTGITGSGSMYCLNFNLGDNTAPPTPLLGLANKTYKTTLNFSLSGLTVGQNLVLTTTSSTAVVNIFQSANVNNPIFNLNSGWVSVGGVIQTVDTNDQNLPGFTIVVVTYSPVSNSAQFLMNPASGASSILYLNGPVPLNLDSKAGYVDFYGTAGGTSQVNYSAAANQEIYTTSSAYSTSRANANGLDRSPSVYQDLVFSGSQTKTADPANLTIGHDFILSVSSTPVADFATNSPAVTVGGNYTANIGTTLNLGGTGTMSVTGISSNAGTLNQTGSGNITFTGALGNLATGVISQNGTGAIIASCCFTNAGSYTQTSGSTGGMMITGNLNNSGIITQTGGNVSAGGNVTNSGTLALGTANFTIGGNYNNTGTYTQSTGTTFFNGSFAETLQDASSNGTNFNNVTFTGGGTKTMSSGVFSVSSTGVLTMAGSSSLASGGNLTLKSDVNGSAAVATIPSGCSITGTVNVERYLRGLRGWVLLSSPVNAGSVTVGSNTTKVYDLNYLLNSTWVSGTGFTTSGFSKNGNPSLFLYRENFLGVGTGYAQSNYRAVVSMSTTTPPSYATLDGTYSVPIGDGYQLYFRGGSGTPTPFVSGTVANPATLTATGTLNQGSVTFTHWYTPGTPGLMYTTVSGTTNIEGFNLVGNPYASTIDLGTYSSGGISMTNVATTVYELNPQNGNYGVYTLGGTPAPTNYASQYIASGQGFFVQAANASATLTFNESCKKASQQNTGNNLLLSKGPVATVVPQYLRLHMALDSINSDETIINFNNQAKTDYVFNEDALYMPGNGKVSLASLSSDNRPMIINTRPLSTRADTIKLKMGATTNGVYSIGVNLITGIPQLYDIWLMDAYKKDSLDMRHNSIYSFNVDRTDTNTYGANRFKLVMRQNPAYAYRLLSFTAARVGNSSNVETNWTTANEANYTNFTVERSNDGGKTFSVVGGMWGTGAGDYGLMDKNALTGSNLYRLKSEDINNNLSYSQLVEVVISPNGNTDKIRLYPNPATSIVNLDMLDKANGNSSYNITVSSNTGLIVKQATSSQPNWQTDVSALLPGTYIVRVTSNATHNVIGESKLVKL